MIVLPEVFVSTDIETDGPLPGRHSMLSFASAAYLPDKTLVGTFSANLETLPGATTDPRTMKWWKTQKKAWAACRVDLQSPEAALRNYVAWVKSLPGTPVFVGYPAGFDFTYLYWYLLNFVGENPFSFAALDIKTYAMSMMKRPFHETIKRNMPRHWFDDFPHTHVALDDALEQGALFCNMLAENLKDQAESK